MGLGVPTDQLIVAALEAGDDAEAERLLAYGAVEAERVFFIFTTWIDAMTAYGKAQLPDSRAASRPWSSASGSRPA